MNAYNYTPLYSDGNTCYAMMIKPSNQTVHTSDVHVQARCTWCGSMMLEKLYTVHLVVQSMGGLG